MVRLIMSMLVIVALVAVTVLSANGQRATTFAQVAPSCAPDQAAQFAAVFAPLTEQLGDALGEPLECERTDPRTGNILQTTTTGVAVFAYPTLTPMFTSGTSWWSLTDTGLLSWKTDWPTDVGLAGTPTSLYYCATRAQPLAYPSATLLAAFDKRHPETSHSTIIQSLTNQHYVNLFAAEALMKVTGMYGAPPTDVRDGTLQFADYFAGAWETGGTWPNGSMYPIG